MQIPLTLPEVPTAVRAIISAADWLAEISGVRAAALPFLAAIRCLRGASPVVFMGAALVMELTLGGRPMLRDAGEFLISAACVAIATWWAAAGADTGAERALLLTGLFLAALLAAYTAASLMRGYPARPGPERMRAEHTSAEA